MLMPRNFFISYLICPECRTKFPIPRKRDRRREKNHIKDLYCPHCRKAQKFVENKTDDEPRDT